MAKERKKLITPPFRLSFPNLFQKASFEGGSAKYGCTALWTPAKFNDKDKKRWSAIKKALDEASLEKFKKTRKELPSSFRKALRKGEDKEGMDGYGEGVIFASLSSPSKPGVIDKNKDPISVEDGNDDEIYAGCWCIATVNAFAFDKGGGKGVALGLQNIMKVKDGARFDSRTDPEDDFDDEEDSRFLDEDDEDDEDSGKKSKKSKKKKGKSSDDDEDDEDEDDEDDRKSKKSKKSSKKKKSRDDDEDEDDEDEDDSDDYDDEDGEDDEDEDDEDDRKSKKSKKSKKSSKKKKSRDDDEDDEDDEDEDDED